MCILCAAGAVAATAGVSTLPLAAARAAADGASKVPHIVADFVRPVLFGVMGINVYSYGIMVASALCTALMVFSHDLERAGIVLDDMHCFFVFLFGFATGSKSHVALTAVSGGEPLTWKALDIRTGHSFMGSIIGAVICMLIFIRYHKVKVLHFLDVLLPCCLLGHVIGKGGCFLSGDGCYGPPADPEVVPWAMSFPNAAVPTQIPVHPTPIYEAVLSFCVFLIARIATPLPQPERTHGRRTAITLVLYGVERTFVEQFRRHPPIELFMGLTEYQALAVGLFIIGAMIELNIEMSAEQATKEGEAEEEEEEEEEEETKQKEQKKEQKKDKKKGGKAKKDD